MATLNQDFELVDCPELGQETYARRHDGELYCNTCGSTKHRTVAALAELVDERYGPLAADRYRRGAAERADALGVYRINGFTGVDR